MKNVFYFRFLNEIGGVESWLYYIAKKYQDLDITIFYRTGDIKQINRLKEYVRTIKYTDQEIECDTFICCFNTEIVDNVKAKRKIFVAHGDYKDMIKRGQLSKDALKNLDKFDEFLGVSQLVCDSFKEMFGKETKLCYNPVELNKPKKVLHLISATRLTKEKGKDRIIKLGEMLNNAGIPYIWTIFTNDKQAINNPNIVYMTPRLDITNYIADADYLVQLSDNEGYCYSVVESLLLGTPVIVTDMPVMKELGVENGVNGWVLDFDLKNAPIDEIYNGLNKFEYKAKEDTWEHYLVKSKSNYDKEVNMKNYKVRALKKFTDVEDRIGRIPMEEFMCTKERYEFLKSHGAVELIEIVEEKKETTKDLKSECKKVQKETKSDSKKVKSTKKNEK